MRARAARHGFSCDIWRPPAILFSHQGMAPAACVIYRLFNGNWTARLLVLGVQVRPDTTRSSDHLIACCSLT